MSSRIDVVRDGHVERDARALDRAIRPAPICHKNSGLVAAVEITRHTLYLLFVRAGQEAGRFVAYLIRVAATKRIYEMLSAHGVAAGLRIERARLNNRVEEALVGQSVHQLHLARHRALAVRIHVLVVECAVGCATCRQTGGDHIGFAVRT